MRTAWVVNAMRTAWVVNAMRTAWVVTPRGWSRHEAAWVVTL
jgi:hypothetical protein